MWSFVAAGVQLLGTQAQLSNGSPVGAGDQPSVRRGGSVVSPGAPGLAPGVCSGRRLVGRVVAPRPVASAPCGRRSPVPGTRSVSPAWLT